MNRKVGNCAEEETFNINNYGKRVPNLPNITRKQVQEHKTADTKIWVTYKNGVYDVTDWVESHPGGNKILLAAGKDLEMFFDMYAVHKGALAMGIMETYRIGNVHPEDMKKQVKKSTNDPFSNDPLRHPAMTINSAKPFCAEPPNELLINDFITPNEIFFVRNHLPVPELNEKHKIQVEGLGMKRPLTLSVDELKKKFKHHTVTATLMCGGNRRSEMAKVKAVRGLSWGTNAISNANWTGVKLADVLEYVGADEDKVNHILFQGSDKDMTSTNFEASVPAGTAFDPRKDCLIAWAMNGKDLPRDHGYPLRIVIPGVIGARNVKWLKKIILSETESQSHYQQGDYKSFNPSTDWNNVDFSKSLAIQETPVQSAIQEPTNGSTLEDDDEVTIRGYAWSGGGKGIIRVDVSVDDGKTWSSAELQKPEQKVHREWAWTLWEITLPIPKDHNGKMNIVCKALDRSHNAQPESAEGIWNLRGLVNNSWPRISVNIPAN